MHTKRIPAREWRQTFDDLSRAFDGAIVSVEISGNEVGAQPEAIDQPLRGISADRGGVTISIPRLDHRIAHPSDVRIVETDEGALIAVEIEEEASGTSTLLHFRSPMRQELLSSAVE